MAKTKVIRPLLKYPPFADRAQFSSQTAANAKTAVPTAPYKLFALLNMAGSFATSSVLWVDTDVGGGNEPWSRYSFRSCEATSV